MLTFQHVVAKGWALASVRLLFQEYTTALNVDLAFQHFNDEVQNPLTKYGAPAGYLLLALVGGEPAGCIALQALNAPGVCEMKRLYTRPIFRKHGIGDALIAKLLAAAATLGYNKMVLDTLPALKPALRLYQKHGFVATEPYYDNPLPGVLYLQYTF